jgi:hypothetical protein
LASYAAAGLDDQEFLNEPILRVFQQGSASRTAQQLQVSRLTKEDLLLCALDMVPKDPSDYYMNVLPARKIIENPDICHDEGVKSIVKLTANLPVGDYMMKEWNDFPQGPDIGAGRPVIQTPDQPLRATNIGWRTELMDPAEASANRSQAPDNIDETHGLKAKAACDVWYALNKMVTNILRHYGAHFPESGGRRNHGCYVDSGGWAPIDIILEWVDGMAYELAARRMQTAFDRNKSARDRRKVHYACALPTKRDRDWNFAVEDIIRIVISSDKNRCQVMRAVCPTTGAAVPRWIRARQGHSLQFIDSMRTSLHLFRTGVETGRFLRVSDGSTSMQHARLYRQCSAPHQPQGCEGHSLRRIEERLFP